MYEKALYDRRWGLVAWMAAIGTMAVVVGALYPVVSQSEGMAELIESLPDSARLFIGGAPDLSTAAGFYNLELFNFFLPLLVSIVVMSQGVAAVAGEEQAGTLDLLLSAPISRTRTVVESYAAVATESVLLTAANGVGMLAADRLFDLGLGLTAVVEANFAAALFGLAVGSGALAAGSWLGARGRALRVVAVAWLLSYLVYAYSDLSGLLDAAKVISVFYLYQGGQTVVTGLSASHAVALAGVSLGFLGLSVLGVNGRDLGVA